MSHWNADPPTFNGSWKGDHGLSWQSVHGAGRATTQLERQPSSWKGNQGTAGGHDLPGSMQGKSRPNFDGRGKGKSIFDGKGKGRPYFDGKGMGKA